MRDRAGTAPHEGRTAVVTGGGRGIGRAVVDRLRADDAFALASDDARHVTGQCLRVDGGLTATSPIDPGMS